MTTAMEPVVCAIHQPNFFPWLGYFDKIRQADIFIFLDAVDYPRSGSGSMGSWTNRVKLAVAGEARWVGCPVQRMPLGAPILAAMIDDSQPWRDKLLKTLDANYRKATRFAEAMDVIAPLIRIPENNVCEFNIAVIQTIAQRLGIQARFVRQSSLNYAGRSTDLLASLLKTVGADVYLAGGGAAGYQQDDIFGERGVGLRYQNFSPSPYGPPARFMPGLSVIDYMMHDGRPLAEAFPID